MNPDLDRPMQQPELGRSQPPLLGGLQIFLQWSRTRFGRIVLVTSIATIITASIALFAFSYNGYCLSQSRVLSDTEYFDAAINYLIQRDIESLKVPTEGSIRFVAIKVVKYRDSDHFRRVNPDCCQIVSHDADSEVRFVGFMDRLFGRAAKSVRLTYHLNYLDELGNGQSALVSAQFPVGNCGRVMNIGY